MAIVNFRKKKTQAVFEGRRPKGFPADLFDSALRKLSVLDAAVSLGVLATPPGNRLEALTGDCAGQHSIRVNDQFRVCFRWTEAGPDGCRDHRLPLRERAMTSIFDGDDEFEIVARRLPPHPGEILREEYLGPLALTSGRLAKACGIARSRLEQIASEKIGISGDTALRLGRVLGTGPELWMNLQARYEIEKARAAMGAEIEQLEALTRAA